MESRRCGAAEMSCGGELWRRAVKVSCEDELWSRKGVVLWRRSRECELWRWSCREGAVL